MGIKTVLQPPYNPDLLPVTFGYSLSSEAVVTKVIDMLTQEVFHRTLQNLLERYNKCIAAGGDYFEGD